MVVAHHAITRAGGDFALGAAGVDVFFMISGFIITHVSSASAASPLRFAWNRLARIAPLYWLVTLALVAIALMAPSLVPRLVLQGDLILASLLFIPHFDGTGRVAPVLVPGWTLNYEIFYYFLFAVALLIREQHRRVTAMTAVLGLLVLVGLIARPDGALAQTYTNPLLLEFVAGSWLAVLCGHRRAAAFFNAALGGLAIALGLAGFVLGAVLIDLSFLGPQFTHPSRALIWGVPALLLVFGIIGLEVGGRLPRLPGMTALGDASYSIYLLHPLLISALWRLTGGPSPGLFTSACLAVSAVAGVICFRLLERPMAAWFKHLPDRLGRRPALADPEGQRR